MLSFHEVYEHHAQSLYRFALWLSGNHQDAEDIASETFVRAWLSPAPLRQATLRAYLLAIARNLYLESQRKAARFETLSEDHRDARPGPAQVAVIKEAGEETWRAMQALSESERSALVLRAVENLSYEQIADTLGISLAAAKVRVHRARRNVADLLTKMETK